jgi:hypothetical protein
MGTSSYRSELHGPRYDRPGQNDRFFGHYEVIRSDVVDLANVRMIQRGDGPCFLLESRAMATFEVLHRDDAIQAGVTSLPNLAHASRAEIRNNLVPRRTDSA